MEAITIEYCVKEWFELIASMESIPRDIEAVNIGLFEIKRGYAVYINGSEEYDEDDEDWACNDDYMPDTYLFFSHNKYARMPWETFQNEMTAALMNIFASDNEEILNYFGNRIVTTGFDDGNLVRIK